MSPNRYIGIDGVERAKEEDQKISLNVHSLFSTPSGKEVLKYLRQITVESVNGPMVTNEALRHHEGQRYIVGLIERRINHAMKVKTNG